MQPNSISVTLAIGSDPYQQRLPTALLRQGMLRRVLRFSPDPEVLDPNDAGSLEMIKRFPAFKFVNRILWAGWRRLPGTRRSQLPKAASTWLADRLASEYVLPSTIFHGFLGVCFACMQVARRQGAVTIVENPTSHLQHWHDEVIAECHHFGVDPRDCSALMPAQLIRRAEREYQLYDKIIVLSSAARRRFEQLGYAHKMLVVWPGVDHFFFKPSPAPETPRLFRVCYTGRVELAKGIGYLLKAWRCLELPNAELLLVGEVKPEMERLLKRYACANVRLAGVLPAEKVAEWYRKSSVFVFPSVNEGFGLVLLEAMASGLAVVASEESGARDCVTEGKDGFVVKPRNVDTLAERILWCYQHRDEMRAMGRSARMKVEQHFTLSHYEERQIVLYRTLGN
jgi:glycosyltransferase involved in cell wall biosynthesis